MDWYKTPSFTIVSAPPQSGKSHLVSYMLIALHQAKRYDYVYIWSPTARANGDYNFIPQNWIFPTYEPSKLARIMINGKQQKQRLGDAAPKILLVFDDCLGEAAFNDKIFLKLASAYRHSNLSVIVTTQYIARLPASFREMCTYIIMLQQNGKKAFTYLWEGCGQVIFDKFKDWVKFVTDNTMDHQVIVCSMQAPQVKAKRFSLFKAPAVIPKLELNFD